MIPRERSLAVRAWHAQLAAASETPALVQHLVRHWGELLPRFVACFEKLRALPRRVRRALGRRRGLSLATVALLVALGGEDAGAATIPVDEITCRLADAILASNNDVATNGCPAGSGADTIVLDADVTLSGALPAVLEVTTVVAGSGSIVDGNEGPCFTVGTSGLSNGDLTLDGLTVRNCVGGPAGAVYNHDVLTIRSCTITGNRATGFYGGGGVHALLGRTYVYDSTVSGNTASKDGGGIRVTGGYLTVARSTISENTATLYGGGVGSYGATTIVTDSVVSGNHASKGGGLSSGIEDLPASLDVIATTVSGNSAGSGGGVFAYAHGEIRLTDSTISGNTATSNGGAVYFHRSRPGLDVALTSTTVTGNTAGIEGGGVHAEPGFAATLTMSHSLVAGNDAPAGREVIVASTVDASADDYNVFGVDGDAGCAGFTPGSKDVVPDPGVVIGDILSPLADNGGPTPTHALVAGGSAVDVIPTSAPNCAGTFDQRGEPRPGGAGCDTGSFEIATPLTFGGSLTGASLRQVSCRNETSGDAMKERAAGPSWDCGDLGIAVNAGDSVQTKAAGTADGSEPFGGSVVGVTPMWISCRNITTGAERKIRSSETSWDCEALGLGVRPGEKVETGVIGTIGPL